MLVSKAGIRPLSSTYTLLVGPYIMGEVRPFQKAKDCEGLNKHHAATCIPPSMDTDRLPPKTMHEPGRKVTLGWTGTFGTKTYLDFRSVLKRLAERGAFRLLVIGNFDYTFEGIDLKVIRWSADREVRQFSYYYNGAQRQSANGKRIGERQRSNCKLHSRSEKQPQPMNA